MSLRCPEKERAAAEGLVRNPSRFPFHRSCRETVRTRVRCRSRQKMIGSEQSSQPSSSAVLQTTSRAARSSPSTTHLSALSAPAVRWRKTPALASLHPASQRAPSSTWHRPSLCESRHASVDLLEPVDPTTMRLGRPRREGDARSRTGTRLLNRRGGGGGIRTHEALRPTRSPGVPNQPLLHPSEPGSEPRSGGHGGPPPRWEQIRLGDLRREYVCMIEVAPSRSPSTVLALPR